MSALPVVKLYSAGGEQAVVNAAEVAAWEAQGWNRTPPAKDTEKQPEPETAKDSPPPVAESANQPEPETAKKGAGRRPASA
jgi:hypothetical protein